MKRLSWYYTDQSKPKNSSNRTKDTLTYLPNPIRNHIVSFLPMKDAIKTKLLSKKWSNIYSSLTHLEFHYNGFKTFRDFRNFFDKTLIVHDGTDIRKFDLFFEVDEELITTDHVNAWVTFAVQHNVQHFKLHLWFKSRKLTRLPACFFTCSTLSVLTLSFSCDLKWPRDTKFPMLRYFSLQSVTFSDEDVTSNLFSSVACPLLEELLIDSCKFINVRTLSISFPSLKFLQLLCENPLVVNLYIPVLGKLDYECVSPPNISCVTLSSLSRAWFKCFMPDTISEECAFRNSARKILMGVQNVDLLGLSTNIIEILARDPDLLAYLPASYLNLTHFSLDKMSTKSHVEVVACLLKTAPNLQTLNLSFEEEDLVFSDIIHRQGYWQLNESSIANSLKHLKNVELEDFEGRESEMNIIRHLLKSASILEEMEISFTCEFEYDTEKRMKVLENLSSFRRVSPHATILFS